MGAFEKIPTESSITSTQLSTELGVDQKLLGELAFL
jgi:hypothetical protein